MERKSFLKNVSACVFLVFVLVSSFEGCAKKADEEKFWILTDFTGRLDLSSPIRDKSWSLLSVIEELSGLSNDQIELEFLPVEQTECSLRIRQLRTEIMAGGGPDLFLLSCDYPAMSAVEVENLPRAAEGYGRNSERLFPDLHFAMKNKVFLPFDDYLVDAEWLDLEQILPAIRDAGRTEEGQMLLPISFTFPCAVYEREAVSDTFPDNWNEALTGNTPIFRYAYGHVAQLQFSDSLNELVDYEKGTLAFSREELFRLVKETISASRESFIPKDEKEWLWSGSSWNYQKDKGDGLIETFPINFWDVDQWSLERCFSRSKQRENSLQVLQPIRNTDGGVTAKITACAGINRNTRQPEKAFQILDILSSDYAQAGKDASEESHMSTVFFTASIGIPARNDLMRDSQHSYSRFFVARSAPPSEYEETARQIFSEYTALRNEVTLVRFYGTLDAELQTMYEACLEAESDEEIEKIVSKAYDTMLMILAES